MEISTAVQKTIFYLRISGFQEKILKASSETKQKHLPPRFQQEEDKKKLPTGNFPQIPRETYVCVLIKSYPPRISRKASHLFFEESCTEQLNFRRAKTSSRFPPSSKRFKPGEQLRPQKTELLPEFFTAKSGAWSRAYLPPVKSPELAVFPTPQKIPVNKQTNKRRYHCITGEA
jgi:hypothetical protein